MPASPRKAPLVKKPARVSTQRVEEDAAAREDMAFRQLAEVIGALTQMAARVKVEGLRDKIEMAANCLADLATAREVLQTEWRANLQAAVRDAADNRVAQHVMDLETKVMEAMKRVDSKLVEHDGVLASLKPPREVLTNDAESANSTWTEVVRRAKGSQPKQKALPSNERKGMTGVDVKRTDKSGRMPRNKPLAVMVTKGTEEFPELLRTVKAAVDPEVTGNSIAKMRRTTQGSLLIEINGGTEAAEKVRQEVARSLGPDVKVRRMGDEAPVEICDLDELVTKDEVLAAVAQAIDGGATRLVSLRRTPWNSQTAVVVLPTLKARRLCASGRIRIGLVYARVRSTELLPRCYRCSGFGHYSRVCDGKDRSDVCWRCGHTGHFGRDCAATPETQAEYRMAVGSATRRGNPTRKEPTAVIVNAPLIRVDQLDRDEPVREADRKH